MIENDKDKAIDYVSKIISLAIEARIHLEIITDSISKSSLVKCLEKNEYSIIYSKTYYETFLDIFDVDYINDNTFMKYDGGYWCGYVYMNIFYKYKKPLSYIFLKLPLSKLLDMYGIYHEMDISQVYEIFEKEAESDTIMGLLLKKHSISIKNLALKTTVSSRTISYYKNSDNNLYKGSFENVAKISNYLDEPSSLFLETIGDCANYIPSA